MFDYDLISLYFVDLKKISDCRDTKTVKSILIKHESCLSVCVSVCPRFSQPPKVPAS